MALKQGVDVKPATGKLGILMPGMGAVATTFIAGVMAIRRGLAKPIGSLTQMGTIRLGKRTDNNTPAIKDYISLATLADIEFGGWDIFLDNAYEAAVRAGVLDTRLLDQLKDELEQIKPMPAVFEQAWVKRLDGPNVKKGSSKPRSRKRSTTSACAPPSLTAISTRARAPRRSCKSAPRSSTPGWMLRTTPFTERGRLAVPPLLLPQCARRPRSTTSRTNGSWLLKCYPTPTFRRAGGT